jgi:hypothetical protein
MIEIIKRGTKHIRICKICGCKFSYQAEDVHREDTDNYKGFKEYVQCPQCTEDVIIRQTR